MNIEIVKKEIKSPALKEVVSTLNSIVDQIQSHEIDYRQGNIEIVGCKHIIQSIALDWATTGKMRTLQLPKEIE